MPGSPRCRSLPGSPRCRQALVAGRPFSGGHILEKGPPRDRPKRCSKSFILWQNLTWQNPASISRIQVCLTSRPSLPGCPRCREALVVGRPSLPVVAGKPSLPGGPRCAGSVMHLPMGTNAVRSTKLTLRAQLQVGSIRS